MHLTARYQVYLLPVRLAPPPFLATIVPIHELFFLALWPSGMLMRIRARVGAGQEDVSGVCCCHDVDAGGGSVVMDMPVVEWVWKEEIVVMMIMVVDDEGSDDEESGGSGDVVRIREEHVSRDSDTLAMAP
ncbi:MAG TPA: hypothetical protein VGO47_02080 [Chlamydiales bacterium]|nr:hypothetical protein [Chlamydiales bacterium]